MTAAHLRPSYFRFLRQLRADGRTNMYGAVPYLMKAFDLDRETAFAVICEWLDRHTEAIQIEPSKGTKHRRRAAGTSR